MNIYERNTTELDRLTRKDRLPLLWRRDPLVEFEHGKNSTRGVYAVNNACFSVEESDGAEKIKPAWLKQFVAMQPDFDLKRGLRN